MTARPPVDTGNTHAPAERGGDLRRFPYPYRAALAVCNDADLLTVENFRCLHGFLSTDEETEWGRGLSLRLGGSFFMYRSPTSPNVFTVFDRLANTVTDAGEEILEWARQGVLDVLHTYGCFVDPSDFRREMAEHAIETLRARGVFVKTWVNHGPPTNAQCVGDHEGWNGDAVGTAAYHSDLTIDYGFRWFWTGLELTDELAMDAARRPPAARGGLRELWQSLRGRGDTHRELVGEMTLRDGRYVRELFRYGGLAGRTPVVDDLPVQLSADNLDTLVRREGFAVVYQHLSVRRLRPGSGTSAYGPIDGSNWFTPAELDALRRLASRHHAGEIWVAPTTELLRYRDARESLRWARQSGADGDEIVITNQTDADDLIGITFYTNTPATTSVVLETEHARRRPLTVTVNPVDGTGRPSVSVAGTNASS